jgi:precorrin-6B methylase 2
MEPRPRRLVGGAARGIRMEIDFEHETRLFLGLYERELDRYFREFCWPGARCFDVGADAGYHTLLMANLTRSDVISFEADPEACADLRRNVEMNPERARRVQVIQGYVGREADGGQLSLDAFCLGDGELVPDVIKIDVDGGETDVLLGATTLLSRHAPHVVLETHSPELESDCGDLLRSAGYSPEIVDQRHWFADYRPIPHNRWLVARGKPRVSRHPA